jgi:hypothetical protein
VRDACCLPADASSAVHSSGPDSDVGPVVLLQLVGEKSLRTAGDHLPPEGKAGETVLIEGGLLHGFSDASKEKVLLPSSAAGFARRQAQQRGRRGRLPLYAWVQRCQ